MSNSKSVMENPSNKVLKTEHNYTPVTQSKSKTSPRAKRSYWTSEQIKHYDAKIDETIETYSSKDSRLGIKEFFCLIGKMKTVKGEQDLDTFFCTLLDHSPQAVHLIAHALCDIRIALNDDDCWSYSYLSYQYLALTHADFGHFAFAYGRLCLNSIAKGLQAGENFNGDILGEGLQTAVLLGDRESFDCIYEIGFNSNPDHKETNRFFCKASHIYRWFNTSCTVNQEPVEILLSRSSFDTNTTEHEREAVLETLRQVLEENETQDTYGKQVLDVIRRQAEKDLGFRIYLLKKNPDDEECVSGQTYYWLNRVSLFLFKDKENKNETFKKTFIHELTHLALDCAFENRGLPYLQDDNESSGAYSRALDKVKNCLLDSIPENTSAEVKSVWSHLQFVLASYSETGDFGEEIIAVFVEFHYAGLLKDELKKLFKPIQQYWETSVQGSLLEFLK